MWQWKRDATFEAGWIGLPCTLTWDKNDLTEDHIMAVVSGVPYGSILSGVVDEHGVPYVSKIPTRTGYKFLGWFTQIKHGTQVNEYTNVEAPKVGDEYEQTYFAHWTLNEYTVTFDANGGEGGKQITQLYGLPLQPPTVTRVGYTFREWDPTPPSTMPGEDATYVAQWDVNYYTATFNPNGGEGGGTQVIAYGDPIEKPEVERTGYSFMGWDSKVPEKMPAEDLVFFAFWELNKYRIVFNANGGEGGWDRQLYYGSRIDVPTVSWKDHIFLGWGNRPLPLTVPDSDMTFVAQWVNTHYRVTFDANGGEGGWSKQLEYGSEIVPPTVTRNGYTFIEWQPDVAEKVPNHDPEYVAQWTGNRYTIELDANGGILPAGAESADVTFDQPIGELPIPTKLGYKFRGWFVGDEKLNPEDEYQYSKNTYAQAKWVEDWVTITMDDNIPEPRYVITEDQEHDIVLSGGGNEGVYLDYN